MNNQKNNNQSKSEFENNRNSNQTQKLENPERQIEISYRCSHSPRVPSSKWKFIVVAYTPSFSVLGHMRVT